MVVHAADSVLVRKDLLLISLPRMELRADPVVATLDMSEIKGKDGEPSEGDGDYESLPAHASLTIHMTAGAVAGILEHTVMYPVDSVKVGLLAHQPSDGLSNTFHSYHYAFLLSNSSARRGGNNLTSLNV